MPIRNDINKVLVIGSGPIIIGQAAEFDYSGTQACCALREEGISVVLVNSNPATIMTDVETADTVYIEPITLESLTQIIKKEKPEGILATLGGQTGLNMAIELADSGILDEYNIELLGTSLESIKQAEDRELFKQTMEEINESIAASTIITTIDEATEFTKTNDFPIIVRPAYTLGGTGGGIADNTEELIEIVSRGLKQSMIHQVLLEQSVAGWKEIEYEVIRDNLNNCIVVCNMENFDPVGIHTGDSIVFAPSQTLSDKEYQMLRSASIKIIRALNIQGGCNIQFALNPNSYEYVVIEVNPRVSRSSALASKATGYPIARVASKIAIGLNLDEIKNSVTQNTYACFEPTLDYVVTKVPRWPFDKFTSAIRTLGTQMKATGEVMAIGRTIEESLLKAIDSLDIDLDYHSGMKKISSWTDEAIDNSLKKADDERIFVISEALNRGYTVEQIFEITKIDPFFINKLKNIDNYSNILMTYHGEKQLPKDLLLTCKSIGFSDHHIAQLMNVTQDYIKALRTQYNIKPTFKMVDTCAGEFEAKTPYYYSSYDFYDDALPSNNKKVIVLGSGPIRIGQGIEFDYCSVHSVQSLRESNVEAIIINSNPETVSTDFDTSDVLYFEPLTKECVMDIIEREKPYGVIVQFGGQTAINLAESLANEGVNILGTSVKDIDRAEDRDKFIEVLHKLDIPLPAGSTALSISEAQTIANDIGYPVLVRPSYVLGGRAMEIVYNNDELFDYMALAVQASNTKPILIDKYITGKELEVDGISDGETVVIPGIMEHIERAGVHSGDSFAVYPPQTIRQSVKDKIIKTAIALGRELKIKGLFNIQFVLDSNNNLYVIEVNPRASRTVPILSKVTKTPMVSLATQIMLGQTLKALNYETGLVPESRLVTVKGPVFSFSKLSSVDIFLGPEMKSTGEVMGTDTTYKKALKKAMIASGMTVPTSGRILFSVADRDKAESLILAKKLAQQGYELCATDHTFDYFVNHHVAVEKINKQDIIAKLKADNIDFIITTPTRGKLPERLGFLLRRTAMEFNIPCITSLDTAFAATNHLFEDNDALSIISLNNYQ